MDLIILIGIIWAARHAWSHGADSRRKAREQRLSGLAKRTPGGTLPPARRRRAVATHDAGWWASEVLHGLPVHRTGWHSGWLAQQTAAVQHRAIREESRTTHLETRGSFMSGLRDHKRRQAEAQLVINGVLSDLQPRGRKAVREAVQDADVLPFRRRTVQAAAPVTDQPFATRRPDGQPETEADSRFFDERESGYDGPLNQDGRRPDMSDPQQADGVRTLEYMRRNTTRGEDGEPLQDKETRPGGDEMEPRLPRDLLPPDATESWMRHNISRMNAGLEAVPHPESGFTPTSGGTMTAPAETTYDQSISEANGLIADAETEIARLRTRRVGQMVENLAAVAVDGGNLSHLADVNDAVEQQIRAAQQQMDSAQAFRDGLIRDHGAGNEYHQAAPGGGAEKDFFRG